MISRITILCFVVFACCNISKKIGKDIDCILNLKAELKDNWKFNPDTLYYQTSDKFLFKLDSTYKYCLYNIPMDSVISILGNPTGVKNNYFEYLVSKPCKLKRQPGKTECTYLRLYFNELKIVKMAEIHYILGSSQK